MRTNREIQILRDIKVRELGELVKMYRRGVMSRLQIICLQSQIQDLQWILQEPMYNYDVL